MLKHLAMDRPLTFLFLASLLGVMIALGWG